MLGTVCEVCVKKRRVVTVTAMKISFCVGFCFVFICMRVVVGKGR